MVYYYVQDTSFSNASDILNTITSDAVPSSDILCLVGIEAVLVSYWVSFSP